MKRLLFYVCVFLSLVTLTGCGWFSNGNTTNETTTTPTVPNQIDDGGTTNNDALNNQKTYKTVADYMDVLKKGGMTFKDELEITDINFPAHEGRQFMMNDEQFYLYRVDSTNADVKNMLDEIDKNGYVTTTQDGKEGKKYAYRLGDFVLIYPDGYDVNKIDSILNKRS